MKILGLLVNPGKLEYWINSYHPDAVSVLNQVLRRPPLVVLSGDVGCGKTELAETIGDAVSREECVNITPLPDEPFYAWSRPCRRDDTTADSRVRLHH